MDSAQGKEYDFVTPDPVTGFLQTHDFAETESSVDVAAIKTFYHRDGRDVSLRVIS